MTAKLQADGTPSALDLLSISQKICTYAAPYIAIVDAEKSVIIQACCNHWDCPRCGEMRAKHEYGRIVNGCLELAKSREMYFYTFTCRGRDLLLSDAQSAYGGWTNSLLSTMRARCKREAGYWAYCQVTERQKRGHPHSHLCMFWIPSDAKQKKDASGKPYIYSKWFAKAHVRVGLGSQSKITPVGSVEATAKYIAKYLFKDTMFTTMPKNWHRVRYSHSFPKLPVDEHPLSENSFPLLTNQDWRRAELSGVTFSCADMRVWAVASKHIRKVARAW